MNRVEIQIPFAGFYESWHDEMCDRAVQDAFTYNFETDEDQELPEAYWNADIDWGTIQQEYVKNYVAAFAEQFELDLQFVEMTSPREYNFTTDRVFVSIPRDQIEAIKAKVFGDEEGRKYVSDRFTSRDGFWSHYDNDLTSEEWTRETLDECQYGVIMDFYVDMLHRDDPNNVAEWSELEYYLVQDFEMSNWDSVIAAQDEVDKVLAKEKA